MYSKVNGNNFEYVYFYTKTTERSVFWYEKIYFFYFNTKEKCKLLISNGLFYD